MGERSDRAWKSAQRLSTALNLLKWLRALVPPEWWGKLLVFLSWLAGCVAALWMNAPSWAVLLAGLLAAFIVTLILNYVRMGQLADSNGDALVEILENSIPEDLLQLVPRTIGRRLNLVFSVPGEKTLVDCRAEVHVLQCFREDLSAFNEEPRIAARLQFEGSTTNVTIKGGESISCVLADASQRAPLQVCGDQQIGPQEWQRFQPIQSGGIWREEIQIYANQGSRRIQLFFHWGPGEPPRAVPAPHVWGKQKR